MMVEADNKGMRLTTLVQAAPEEPQALLAIILRFNTACNWLSQVAFAEKLFRWLPLQQRAYYELRKRFGLSSAEAVTAIRKVAYVYSDRNRRTQVANGGTAAPAGRGHAPTMPGHGGCPHTQLA